MKKRLAKTENQTKNTFYDKVFAADNDTVIEEPGRDTTVKRTTVIASLFLLEFVGIKVYHL